MDIMEEDYISTKEAAKKAGFSEEHIRKLVKKRLLKGRKIGRDWLIVPSSVDEYLASERKRGPKPLDK